VIVSVNYRLGVLGFFSLGTPGLAGNMGLKDQMEALKWVQTNIRSFGGDPSKVTIFGESAGAMSVSYHQVSPQGNGLYRGIISQSGMANYFSIVMHTGRTITDSIRLTEDLGCLDKDVTKVTQCLQDVDSETLILKTLPNFDGVAVVEEELDGAGPYVFVPIIDSFSPNPFLPEHPINTIRAGRQKDIPVIAGVTANEGSITLNFVWNRMDDFNRNWTTIGPRSLYFIRADEITEHDELIANVTRHFYTGEKEFSTELKDEMLNLLGDYFTSSVHRAVQHQAETQKAPVFMYELTHKASRSLQELFGLPAGAENEDFGVGHGDDLVYIFTKVGPFTGGVQTDEDEATRDIITTLWTNFAKYLDPTPFQEDSVPTWKPITPIEDNYLEIKPESESKEGFRTSRMYFWSRLFWEDLESDIGSKNLPQVRFQSIQSKTHQSHMYCNFQVSPGTQTSTQPKVTYGFVPSSSTTPASQQSGFAFRLFDSSGQFFPRQIPNRNFA
jgi:carboxylesterase type B